MSGGGAGVLSGNWSPVVRLDARGLSRVLGGLEAERRRSYRYRAAMGRDACTRHVVRRVFRGLLQDFPDVAAAGLLEASEALAPDRLDNLIRRMEFIRQHEQEKEPRAWARR